MCWFQVILLTLNLALHRELGERGIANKNSSATWEGSAHCNGPVKAGPVVACNWCLKRVVFVSHCLHCLSLNPYLGTTHSQTLRQAHFGHSLSRMYSLCSHYTTSFHLWAADRIAEGRISQCSFPADAPNSKSRGSVSLLASSDLVFLQSYHQISDKCLLSGQVITNQYLASMEHPSSFFQVVAPQK